LHGLFRQDNFGKDLAKRKDKSGAEYKKDFKSFKQFVHRILTDYDFATEVAIKYDISSAFELLFKMKLNRVNHQVEIN